MTRKNPFVLEIGMLAFCKLVLTTPLHNTAGNASARSNTNGAVPPVQLRFTFVPARAMATVIVGDTVITTAS